MLAAVAAVAVGCGSAGQNDTPGGDDSAPTESTDSEPGKAPSSAIDPSPDPDRLALERAEVPWLLSQIRAAELTYMEIHGTFLGASVAPRPDSSLDATPADWGDPVDWEDLGWTPPAPVRGDYQVAIREGDFDALGHSDVDDDERIAVYRATSTTDPERLTNGATY